MKFVMATYLAAVGITVGCSDSTPRMEWGRYFPSPQPRLEVPAGVDIVCLPGRGMPKGDILWDFPHEISFYLDVEFFAVNCSNSPILIGQPSSSPDEGFSWTATITYEDGEVHTDSGGPPIMGGVPNIWYKVLQPASVLWASKFWETTPDFPGKEFFYVAGSIRLPPWTKRADVSIKWECFYLNGLHSKPHILTITKHFMVVSGKEPDREKKMIIRSVLQ